MSSIKIVSSNFLEIFEEWPWFVSLLRARGWWGVCCCFV